MRAKMGGDKHLFVKYVQLSEKSPYVPGHAPSNDAHTQGGRGHPIVSRNHFVQETPDAAEERPHHRNTTLPFFWFFAVSHKTV